MPLTHPALDATSRRWLEQLRPGHPRREAAVARLHDLLLRAARQELRRRRGRLAGPSWTTSRSSAPATRR